MFTHKKSVSAPLRSDVVLSCGFKQHEIPLAQEVGIEWRLQHRGKGEKVLEMKTRLDDAEGSTVGKLLCKQRGLLRSKSTLWKVAQQTVKPQLEIKNIICNKYQ